ncbi:MAG: hypothetical protein A2W90_17395 [Bacteroidetes bacterium GWF2_42_66]|nr:MAG: hypothetical protein A2W92_21370 [Bacteroidetes bacterium GWA2_42_15]OFX97671.1 MAG: hypothetical protein A2W89_19530 [Bacteroidetes bacterium GWE2_42_39]OFY46919.1 MAG: hypothetical protein A2W90_17395 [Bacteroidetes bacterium GWF2_42_66]HAZ03047.1 hypothetical protein [Marinilabiliales bacterium]HBL75719.1 hypothetical protein [Prolixibacteraceae bacterium]
MNQFLKKRRIAYYIILISFLFWADSCKSTRIKTGDLDINYTEIEEQSLREALRPVRPGVPGKTPFWNNYAKQFIYAPSFNFNQSSNSKKYKFVVAASDSLKYEFFADHSWADLSPVWENMPQGFARVEVFGLGTGDSIVELCGSREFYKASPFQGPYHAPVMKYDESAKQALSYLFNRDYIRSWEHRALPDSTYELYCYPAKIIGAITESMLLFSKLSPEHEKAALSIAKNAAKYLISISEPKGAPLEFLPPTYAGEARTAKNFKDQFMMIYPAKIALTYLDLFDITQENEFKDAAVRIAETYLKLQLPSGTWKLKLRKDGSPVTDNDCIPLDIIQLFDRLVDQYRLQTCQASRDRAFSWIMDNPVITFDWSGQFEDIAPLEPYKNLSKDEASALAVYLFGRSDENDGYTELAEELLRFCEDQFVIWENPMPQKQYNVSEWITPCVLEQYSCYEPINASASNMMESFLKAYEVTGKAIYLAKAVELANAMTVAQIPENGRYPTYWQLNERRIEGSGWIDWLNCTSYSAKIMFKMAEFINRK